MANENVKAAVEQILVELGEDPGREGLKKTPERVARSLEFFTRGYAEEPAAVVGDALFVEEYSEMILVRDIDFFSLCEHHMLPFFGRAHVAYVPDHHIVGISKICRMVECYARRLQVQERMTMQIVQELQQVLGTEDVACVVDAKHLCVNSRGIRDIESSTVTSEFGGAFKQKEVRREFLDYIKLDTTF